MKQPTFGSASLSARHLGKSETSTECSSSTSTATAWTSNLNDFTKHDSNYTGLLEDEQTNNREPSQAEFALDLIDFLNERKTIAGAHGLMVREQLAGNHKVARAIAKTILESVDLADLPARTLATCYLVTGIKDGNVVNLKRVQMAVEFFNAQVERERDRVKLAKNLRELHCLKRLMWAAEAEADKKMRRRKGSVGMPEFER